MDSDRRRETRLTPGEDASFRLETPLGEFSCKVLNLSRLGVGVELPDNASGVFFDSIAQGSHVIGSLLVGSEALKADAVVRVRKGRILGLEYAASDTEFHTALRRLLSPQYVAASIHRIGDEHLASDIEAAYRGSDFELVLFKAGALRTHQMMQIYCDGVVAEATNGQVRVVPPLLIRPTAGQGRFDFLREFAELAADQQKERKIEEFFARLARICSAWNECPAQLRQLVSQRVKGTSS